MILSEEIKRIYIGWDSREDIAFQVARQSILDKASNPDSLEIIPLKQEELRNQGLYWRDEDKLGSTEFTFTRFLLPELDSFNGWALFIDCDFLFLDDIEKLFKQCDDRYALMCAKHDYTPTSTKKMDGKKQSVYPRKNWSSMMLVNCGHQSNKKLTKELVNDPSIDGKYLHRFSWLSDAEIGQVSHEWNWLVGWYNEEEDGKPRALHYTEGGPWFKNYQKCEYAVDWLLAEKRYLKVKSKNTKHLMQKHPFQNLNNRYNEVLQDVINYMVDPEGKFYSYSWNDIEQKVKDSMTKVVAINTSEVNLEKKDLNYDPILKSFVMGVNGTVSTYEDEKNSDSALVIRGVGGGSRKAIQECQQTGRDFYTVDTGYFGNVKSKVLHRVTKNDLQNCGPIIDRPMDRAKQFGYKFKKFTPGSKILICPPSLKVMDLFGQPNPEEWVKLVTAEIRKYSDRPLEIRMKPNRTERVTTKTMQAALQEDIHCLVTYNSIAAVEALMEGKPAIVLGPNAAASIAETKIENIDKPKIPTRQEMDAFMAHLAYCQFTVPELRSGFAWETVNESSELPIWDS
jgi:lipopolysaccharide biosynthesis glycosyltransferase